MTESSLVPGQNIPLASLPNLRDLGGYRTGSGSTVRRGRLFRSVDLSRLDDGDLSRIEDLGIRTIFDLRTASEREASPDRGFGAKEIALDVMADANKAAPANLGAFFDDPAAIEEFVGGGADLFRGAYRDLILLPSARSSYSRFFADVAGAAELPALFHCTTGKDRTGWAAASVLLFLGVPEENVMHDYLLTNEQLLPALSGLMDKFREQGGDPDLLLPVLGVDETYLRTAIDTMTENFGSIQGYVDEALGVPAETQAALRERLLED